MIAALARLRLTKLPLSGLLFACISCSAASSATYTPVHAFTGAADGAAPEAGVVSDSAGNLYGENANGALQCFPSTPTTGCGVVYKIDLQGNTTALVTFNGGNGEFGTNPLTVVGKRLFGAVSYDSSSAGAGLLFAVNTDGSGFKILHKFRGKDGFQPNGALRVMPNGVIYGTTRAGGNLCNGCLAGVLFELDPDGTYTALHNFDPSITDGSYEPGQIFVSHSGTIYGSTQGYRTHGEGDSIYVFEPSTGVFRTLHRFFTDKDGAVPQIGGLTKANVLYGATELGGPADHGTLFQLGAGGFQTLYAFQGGALGGGPNQPTMNTAGQIIGTVQGVNANGGALYSFSNDTLTILYSFSSAQGALSFPRGGLTLQQSGAVVGAAYSTNDTICKLADGTPIAQSQGCGGIFSILP